MARKRDKVAYVRCWGEPNPDDRCPQGCLGCGACVEACRANAIFLSERGVAQVNREACVACGLCVRACPQGIIGIVPRDARILPLCSNTQAPADARRACPVSCIGCGACERSCPADAIHVIDSLAVTDTDACIACGMCATKCPRGTIHDATGILASAF